MTDIGIIGLLIIIANSIVSYHGFKSYSFLEQYKFEVDKLLINKEYLRFISSGFLHVNWMHLIFNMISLLLFSGLIEHHLGELNFIIIYFSSLIGGNLFALFIHRQHGDYSAVGASGAVCGVIFASIALFPELGIGFFGLPIHIPSWLYGILYVGYSVYGIKAQKDAIGHEAHLGGALIGMLTAITLRPDTLLQNYVTIAIITVPTIVLIFVLIRYPQITLLNSFSMKQSNNEYGNIDHRYNEAKKNKEIELNKILDKIAKKGLLSLSKKEKQRLDELSK